jgi:hypothetical protein
VLVILASMMRRPISLTIAAWLFILVGAGGILNDVLPLLAPDRSAAMSGLLAEGAAGLAFIWVIRFLAVAGGAYVLRGRSWARWLLAAWMVFHVVVGVLHSLAEAAAHVAVFSLLSYCLFRPQATAWFVRQPSRLAREPE